MHVDAFAVDVPYRAGGRAGASARRALDDARAGQPQLCLDATAALVDAAETGPTLLVVEDAQWADEASAELIRHLLLSGLHEATTASLPLVAVLTGGGQPPGPPQAVGEVPQEQGPSPTGS